MGFQKLTELRYDKASDNHLLPAASHLSNV
jgi:hypothetical protein